ncbi:MAG TPA: ABC transporter permease [Fimbriimonadaceae bacterium]|nr:ABC transporter permease [Fimbriimonadaceae bacterium]
MKRTPAWAWAAIALMLVLVFNAVFTPGFLEITVRDGRLYGSLIDILNRAAPVGLLALGMTLVIATGGIDLSVGAVMAIAGTVAANAVSKGGTLAQAVGPALLAGAFSGSLNGFLVAVLEFQPIVAPLLLLVTGRGIAQMLANGQIVTFNDPSFAEIGRGAFAGVPNAAWILAIFFLVFAGLTRLTGIGLLLESTGSNSAAAKYVGINTKALKSLVYTLSGLCAAVAGLIITADIQAADANNAGLYLELDAILAVSVGGTALAGGRFSLAGSIIGALLMQALTTTILTRGVSPEATLVVKAAIIIAVCLMQVSSGNLRLGRAKA